MLCTRAENESAAPKLEFLMAPLVDEEGIPPEEMEDEYKRKHDKVFFLDLRLCGEQTGSNAVCCRATCGRRIA